MKIYRTDSNVPYSKTKLTPNVSRSKINAVLAYWDITDVAWHWDLPNDDIFVVFWIMEVIDGIDMKLQVKVKPPLIWNKGRGKGKESINWAISMRVMFWYIKSHLEMAYLQQSSKVTEFLPYIQVPSLDGKPMDLKDIILVDLNRLKALPEKSEKIIDVK